MPGQYGGTGRLADWGVAQQAARSHPVILAGGLNAENVAAAILQVRPYGVDVARMPIEPTVVTVESISISSEKTSPSGVSTSAGNFACAIV